MIDSQISGRELELLLSGKKPLAVFYRATHEKFDEKSGQDFTSFVRGGLLSESRFFVRNRGQSFTIMYVLYCRRGEEWRSELYKKIKKIGQEVWNEDLERFEGWLLGC